MNVHLFGPYPPPYGGVSVHVSRLRKQLLQAGHQVTLWCQYNRPKENLFRWRPLPQMWRCLCALPRGTIIHFHDNYLLAGLVAWRRPVLATVYNSRINQDLSGGASPLRRTYRSLARWAFRKLPCLIAGTDGVGDTLVEFGFDRARIHVISHFLPPAEGEVDHPQDSGALPESVRQYVREHDPVISAAAWIGRTYDGCDLYGVDMMIELIERLRKDHPDIGLVICVNGGDQRAVRAATENATRRVGSGILLATGGMNDASFMEMLRSSDLFLRPTNTDGNAVSVCEALYHRVPVVTSSAVPRPESCILFRTRDADDFERKVRAALGDLPRLRESIPAGATVNNAVAIAELYEELPKR